MKIKESAENYLETILMLKQKNGSVRSIDVATELGFSKPSISYAMKLFRENGYIEIVDGGNIILTEKGNKIAVRIYQRHKLLTKLFMNIGVSEAIAKEDACRIEHYLSDETFEKLSLYFNNLNTEN